VAQSGDPTVGELRRQMTEGIDRLLSAVDKLESGRVESAADEAGWTIKDHLAHLAVWADGIAALLDHQNRWAAMGLAITDSDRAALGVDAINDLVIDRFRNLNTAAARTWLVEAHARVLKALDSFTDEDLLRPYGQFAGPADDAGDAIVGYIASNTFDHYDEHIPWLEAIARTE
jgi:hypothetical protein